MGGASGSIVPETLQLCLGLSLRTRDVVMGAGRSTSLQQDLNQAEPCRSRKRAGPGADTPRRAASEGVSGRAEFPARSPASRVPWSRPPPLPCWIVRLLPPLPPPPED